MDFLCPACGYALDEPAWEHDLPSNEMCPCCGIQFGYDDHAGGDAGRRKDIYRTWRSNWIKNGMKWYSAGKRPPIGWNPVTQLEMAGF